MQKGDKSTREVNTKETGLMALVITKNTRNEDPICRKINPDYPRIAVNVVICYLMIVVNKTKLT